MSILILASLTEHAFADATPESYSHSCKSGIDDSGCWQAAINASITHRPQMGVVSGTSGKIYYIKKTITVCNVTDGVIDGHGAVLEWVGPSSVPMFQVINAAHVRFANFTIKAFPSKPLDTAFKFTSYITTPKELNDECGVNLQFTATKNSIDHVTVEGTDLNGLNYGVRFTHDNDPARDINNDMSTITDTTFYNVTKAAISIESTQSGQHRFISVNGYAAGSGNKRYPGACFINAPTGMFSSVGGIQWNWAKANFCVDGPFGAFDITDSNSEKSNRLLLVGSPGEVAGYPVRVNVQGGRFAVDGLNPDGKIISFNRLGGLTVRGLAINGIPPESVVKNGNPVNMGIAIEPGGAPPLSATAIIEGVAYYISTASGGTYSSETWNTITAKNIVTLIQQGNICMNSGGLTVACKAPLRN